MKVLRHVILPTVLFWAVSLQAQAAPDTLAPVLPSARGAVIRSAVFPGWGQWHNGAKWKTFVVLAGEAALFGVSAVQNQRAQDAVGNAARAVDETLAAQYNASAAFYRDDRDRFVWYGAGLWLLNIIDAYVDAKLRYFDIGPDLSIRDGLGVSLAFSW